MPQKKKPARGTPQARGDAQNPISCSRHQAPGEQAARGCRLPRGRSALQGPGTDRPAPRPRQHGGKRGANAALPGSGAQPGFLHGPRPHGRRGPQRAPGCREDGAATGSRKRNLLWSGAEAEHFLRLTAAAGSAAVVCAAGAQGRWPHSPVLGGGGRFRGSAPQAPGGQDSRTEAQPCGDTGGRLGTRAVCTPGVLPRTARGKAEPFSQIHLTLILI